MNYSCYGVRKIWHSPEQSMMTAELEQEGRPVTQAA